MIEGLLVAVALLGAGMLCYCLRVFENGCDVIGVREIIRIVADSGAAYFHAFAIAFVALVAAETRLEQAIAISSWIVTIIVFEFGQLYLTDLPPNTGFLEPMRQYFANGQFDVKDVIASLMGTISAIAFFRIRRRSNSWLGRV